MPRILVTGANGFLGRYATEALIADGWDVVGTGRRLPDRSLIRFVAADLLTRDGIEHAVSEARADVLLHLAWFDDPRARWSGPENLDWVAATLDLARRFSQSGGRRFVFGSSCAVYDFAARTRHRESDQTAPNSLYGIAKASTGSLLTAAGPVMNLAVAEARMFFCYGGGEPPQRLVSDLIAGLAAGQRVKCTDGQQKRDYLHAADIGRALSLISGAAVEGPVNVASGRSIRVADLIHELAKQMNQPGLPELGAIPRPKDDPDEIVADTSILAGLDFRAEHDLATGVAESLRRQRPGIAS
ncbi:MAG: NAD(P)-dependent oxidoreductase [Silicimonas sp.]|nr:NAD(P)-dependent oxidoreductase [Silicimonas sp.]